MALKLQSGSESPGGLLKTQTAGFFPRLSGSVVLRRGLGICISNTFLRVCCLCYFWNTLCLEFSPSHLPFSFTYQRAISSTEVHVFCSAPGFCPSAGLRELKAPLPPLLAKSGCSIIPFQRTFLLGPRSVALSLFVMGILYPLGRGPSSD